MASSSESEAVTCHDIALGNLCSSDENKDSLLSVMSKLQKTKCTRKKIELLRSASTGLRTTTVARSSLHTAILRPLFVEVVHLAVPEEFPDRGHHIFEKEDFVVVCNRTEVVLNFLTAALENCFDDSTDFRLLDECLPTLLVVLTANLRNNLWSKDSVKKLTLVVLNQLRIRYKVDSLSELLQLDLKRKDREITTPGCSLCGQYLDVIKTRLSKQSWQANPTFVESLYWTLTQMIKFPHLSEHLDTVLPPALMFVDSHVAEHKIMGIQCLQHIAANVTSDQLRWYGRAEVVYAALKQQLYSREPEVIRALHPALLTVVPIIDKNPARPAPPTSLKQVDCVLSIIITSAVTENGLVLRRLYTQCIADFVDSLGVCAVRHLGRLVSMVCDYLEVFDGPSEQARLNTLRILTSLLRNAWPQIPTHADAILRSLLKLIQDVACDCSATSDGVKEVLKKEAVQCLSLLQELCPHVKLCLRSVCESEELTDVAMIVQEI